MKRILLLLNILLITSAVMAQTSEEIPPLDAGQASAMAKFIYKQAEKTTWPEESLEPIFRIGILNDSALFAEMFETSFKRKIHDRPVQIVHVDNLDEVHTFQVFYCNGYRGYPINIVHESMIDSSVLLITRGYDPSKTMISVEMDGRRITEGYNYELMELFGLRR